MSLPEEQQNNEKKDYEVLPENFSRYDLSFKLIVIGNSGNIKLINNNHINIF